ncbi:MAG: pirin family protein, partial [Myxococcales bacterium]|nr:pirin family protein [Myxococcales bacterium]
MIRPTGNEPTCTVSEDAEGIDTIISARTRDIGGFNVGRVLPAIGRRMVGPFIFFDHMGPGDFEPGQGLDVRPHPHINLATVTYLFEGEIHHRDSLGSSLAIRPGAINWMTAGRGIVHSERSGDEARARGGRLHGIQLWVALPRKLEEVEPSFRHHPAESIPGRKIDEVEVRVLAGEAYGLRSPVRGLSRLFYVEAKIPRGAELVLPDNYPERAAYVVSGAVVC